MLPVFIPVLAGHPNGSTNSISHAGRRMIVLLYIVITILAICAVFGTLSYLEHKSSSQCQITTSNVEKNRTENNGKVYSACNMSQN